MNIDIGRGPYETPIDVAERQYRQRYRNSYNNTVDSPRPQYQAENVRINQYTVDGVGHSRSSFGEDVKISDETVEPARFNISDDNIKMGYHDDQRECLTNPCRVPAPGRPY